MAAAHSPAVSDFPPQDLRRFLEFCAGEWLSVRSSFLLLEGEPDAAPAASPGAIGAPEGNDAGGQEPAEEAEERWHAALRGELAVLFLAPERPGDPGGLRLTPPQAAGGPAAARELHFDADGGFQGRGAAGEARKGSWRLWPDGSLELSQAEAGSVIVERIWFTKPNLRLRSCIEQRQDGRPSRASFSSEIRRVSRAAAPVQQAAATAPSAPGQHADGD